MRRMNMRMGVYLVMAVMVIGVGLAASCPSDCVCKWKGGKQTVECVSRALRTFPPTIDPGTQVLDMSGNSFETLPPDHFMRSGLINLQKIFLSKCRLSHINSRAFRGLSNLVELDLSSNLLRDVPTSAFPDCQGLMRLVLNRNPIAHIQKRAFVPLTSLTTLELSHTGTELIEYGAFEGLVVLEWLKLDGNRLKKLSGLGLLGPKFKGVALEENPWECDCHLLELRLWLSERAEKNNVAIMNEPRCNGPERLANQTIKSLSSDNFACFPQLSPTTMFQKIGEGKNVSLLCKVLSVPESSLEWLFNGQTLTNSSLNLLVETTNAYPVGSLPSPSSSSSLNNGGGLAISPIEKKSELLILNATSEENGTFLCVAKNPAGMAIANFTLRVLGRYDVETATDYSSIVGFGQIPQLVSDYPNLFIIVLSTVAVIGLVIVVVCITFILCKCSHLCIRRSPLPHPSSNGMKSSDKKNGGVDTLSSVVSRNLSEVSTLTINTKSKSNGSVFLLSSSSQEMGDSNPDLIEGVKRVDGDGLESVAPGPSLPSYSDPIFYSPNSAMHAQIIVPRRLPVSQSYHHPPPLSPSSSTQGYGHSELPPGESSQGISWPVDFGLPKGISLTTSNAGFPSTVNNVVPPNYDLSKYPKEYINPQRQQSTFSYNYSPGSLVYSPNNQVPNCYPGYMMLPQGPTYSVYSVDRGQEEYIQLQPGGPNCSCGPILKGNETEDEMTNCKKSCTNEQTQTTNSPPKLRKTATAVVVATASSSNVTTTTTTSVATGTDSETSDFPQRPLPSSQRTPATKTTPTTVVKSGILVSEQSVSSNDPAGSNVSRPQVQFTLSPLINESPDEGYEDEGAEGTEI